MIVPRADELKTINAEDWRDFRDLRLRALADATDAFGAVLADVRDQPEELWRSRAGGPSPTLLGYAAGEPVTMGGIFVPEASDTGWVWGMWTAPEVRGQGWAGRVLDALLAWAAARDLGVALHVTQGNDAARRLYIGRGFAPTGVWEPLREGSDLQIEELRLAT